MQGHWAQGSAVNGEKRPDFPVYNPPPHSMASEQPNNPLHGITLETILRQLVDRYGWAELGRRIEIRCFNVDPSIPSSLKFLRRTPWARERVESLYVHMLHSSTSE
jgi:uncharacterized protein (DUF2132 family)